MIWIFTIICEVLFGCEVTFFILINKVDFFVQCAIGTIVGICLSTLIFFGCSAIFGITAIHLIMHTIGISIIANYLLTKRFIQKKFLIRRPTKDKIVFFIISIFTTLFILPKNGQNLIQQDISKGMSEEISIINSFYHGANSGLLNIFKIRHPCCYKCVCRSRWITALHSSMLRIGYLSFQKSIYIPSFLFINSFIFIYLNLANIFIESVFGSIVSFLVFCFVGGFGFKNLLYKDVRNQKNLDFVQNNGFYNTNWCHPLFQYLLSSRPSQLSLCVCASIFYILSICDKQALKRREMAMIGILFGFLPGSQFQVFLAVFVYLIGFFAINFDFNFNFRKTKLIKEKKYGLVLFLTAFSIVSFLQFLPFLIPRDTNSSILVKRPLFYNLIQKGVFFPMLKYWFDALGFFPIVTLLLSWFLIDVRLLKIYFPSLIIFVWANNALFQHVDYMNITVLYPCWMILASIAYIRCLKKVIFTPKSEELQGFIFGLCIFFVLSNIASGIYGYFHLRNNFVQIWNQLEEEAAKWIVENTPKKSVFISSSDDFDIVSALAGKVQFFQSSSLCNLYGFKSKNQSSEIQKLLNQSDSTTLAYKVEYIVNYERNHGRQLVHWGRGNWTKEFSNREVTIYKRNLMRKKNKL